MVLMKEFVLSLNKKTTQQHWSSYFQIAPKYKHPIWLTR